MSWALPTIEASTFHGQLLWFVTGFVYASVIMSVAHMIAIFRRAAGNGAPFEG